MSRVKEVYKFNCTMIDTNTVGINHFMDFYKKAKLKNNIAYELDFNNCTNIEANLSAVLIAIIHRLKIENNHSFFINFPTGVSSIFYRNGFFSAVKGSYNDESIEDFRASTIPLRSFNVSDDDKFISYLKNDFFAHRSFIYMTKTVKSELINHFIEVFNNAFLHSDSKYPIFCCGQFFPEKKLLKFTFVDLGNGFLKKIKEFTNGEVETDLKALDWAFKGANTTKDQKWGSGGIGLKDLKQYCKEKNGKILVLSGESSLTFLGDKPINNRLSEPFVGSIICLTFTV